MALPPIFIEFLGDYTGLKETADGVKKELAEVDAEGGGSLESLGAVSTGVLLGMGAALVGAGYESSKLAISFQSAMEQIHTQAGVPQAAIQGLGNDVLQLAGQVGFSPDSLAEALYHIESSFASVGITGAQAMNILKIAAEGAATGHADLVDVQNALDAAIASGIPGVENYSQAMGALNAIVGSGDMTMQDLADAMGSGAVAVVKTYGLSLNDVGAALATFGDNNIRGAVAATDMRMAVQSLAVPAATASVDLKKMGMTTSTLADDMKKGGLQLALNDLSNHMKKAGLAGLNMGNTLTEMFGKKAGVGLGVLMDQIDRFNSKYPSLEAGANNFGSAVSANNATMAQKIADIKASFESLGTTMGQKLLPIVSDVLGKLASGISWLAGHQSAFYMLAAGLTAVTVALTVVKLATIEWTATLLANPAVWIAAAIMALGAALYYAYTHSKTFRDVIADVGNALKAGFTMGVQLAGDVVRWFDNGPMKEIQATIKFFQQFWQAHGLAIEQIAKVAWLAIETIIKVVLALIIGYVKPWLVALEGEIKFTFDFIWNYIKMVFDLIVDIVKVFVKTTMDGIGLFVDLITGKWSKLGDDMRKLTSDMINGIVKIFTDFAHNALHLLEQAGKDIVNGLINGIKSMIGSAVGVGKDLGNAVKSGIHGFLSIFSPSRVTYQSGQYTAQGLINGLKDAIPLVHSTAGKLGAAVMSGFGTPKLGISGLNGGTGFGGQLGAAGLSGGGNTIVQNTVNINNAGSVLAENELRDQVQQAMLRLGGRNASTWAPAHV